MIKPNHLPWIDLGRVIRATIDANANGGPFDDIRGICTAVRQRLLNASIAGVSKGDIAKIGGNEAIYFASKRLCV